MTTLRITSTSEVGSMDGCCLAGLVGGLGWCCLAGLVGGLDGFWCFVGW